MTFFQVLYPIDRTLSDAFFQKVGVVNPKIKIIAIDDRTLEALGPFNHWQRDVYLNKNDDKPALIGFDITFNGETQEDDELFALEASKASPVVIANHLIFENKVSYDNGLKVNPYYVTHKEDPILLYIK